MDIVFQENPTRNIKILVDGINTEAKQKKGQNSTKFFGFFIKDKSLFKRKKMGGVVGLIIFGCIYIDILWIDKSIRNKGYGSMLMKKAEEYGKENGCTFATVNTMDWQALDFYKKNGYEVEFERKGFAKNSTCFYLRKNFS